MKETTDLIEQIIFTVGRSQNNNIVINHSSISRIHAKISQKGATFVVEDLKSSNGTFYKKGKNKIRISKEILSLDHEISFGQSQFMKIKDLINIFKNKNSKTEEYDEKTLIMKTGKGINQSKKRCPDCGKVSSLTTQVCTECDFNFKEIYD
jgi:pSer/pThr/pTyr-binding forkhead associated (FHA) protein